MTEHEKKAHRFLDILVEADIEGVKELVHSEAVMEFPFAPEGAYSVDGHEAIVAYFEKAFGHKSPQKFDRLGTYLMKDEEHVFLEFKGYLENTKGETYTNDYCALYRFKDGKIILFREFYNALIREKYDSK